MKIGDVIKVKQVNSLKTNHKEPIGLVLLGANEEGRYYNTVFTREVCACKRCLRGVLELSYLETFQFDRV